MLTKESNPAYAFCCDPDSTDLYCGAGKLDDFECSPPSYERSPETSPYKPILSAGNRNYQMFAYCSTVNQRACGISKETSTESALKVKDIEQVVYSKEMRYRLGTVQVREYDFCHYELAKDPDPKMQEIIDEMKKKAH